MQQDRRNTRWHSCQIIVTEPEPEKILTSWIAFSSRSHHKKMMEACTGLGLSMVYAFHQAIEKPWSTVATGTPVKGTTVTSLPSTGYDLN